ncbi:MAG: hypothetical protein KC549_11735 [Myxococcales bacterium]|nr:hypothetical protein [Myxococcales bacterium]
MDLRVDGAPVEPRRFGVRELGYGQPVRLVPTWPYVLRVPWPRFWAAAAPATLDMILDTFDDDDPTFAWIVAGWDRGAELAPQVEARRAFVLRLVAELLSQDVLFALFPGPWDDLAYAANDLADLHLDGDDVVLRGEAYAVRR